VKRDRIGERYEFEIDIAAEIGGALAGETFRGTRQ
jgi:hypothetical protein